LGAKPEERGGKKFGRAAAALEIFHETSMGAALGRVDATARWQGGRRGPRPCRAGVTIMTVYSFILLVGVVLFNSALFAFLFSFIRKHARRDQQQIGA